MQDEVVGDGGMVGDGSVLEGISYGTCIYMFCF